VLFAGVLLSPATYQTPIQNVRQYPLVQKKGAWRKKYARLDTDHLVSLCYLQTNLLLQSDRYAV
jgi:hypothetical protein